MTVVAASEGLFGKIRSYLGDAIFVDPVGGSVATIEGDFPDAVSKTCDGGGG